LQNRAKGERGKSGSQVSLAPVLIEAGEECFHSRLLALAHVGQALNRHAGRARILSPMLVDLIGILLVKENGSIKVERRKRGPEHVPEEEACGRALPEKEITEADLAARSDEQVNVA